MVNNRTPAQTRWGLGFTNDEEANGEDVCRRCRGVGTDRDGKLCPDCADTGGGDAEI